jgi:hypothetical protein
MLDKFSSVSISLKKPKLEGGIGIFSLNKSMNNFSTVHAIFAQIRSIDAVWRTKVNNFNAVTKFVRGVTIVAKCLNGDSKPKHPVE